MPGKGSLTQAEMFKGLNLLPGPKEKKAKLFNQLIQMLPEEEEKGGSLKNCKQSNKKMYSDPL